MSTRNTTTLSSVPSSASTLLNLRIAHPRIAQVMRELDTLIYPGSETTILLVCGPTGAGKTVLARNMVGRAYKAAREQMESCAGIVPAVYAEAPSSGENNFSWRLFYQRILSQLGDNLESPKVAYGIDPNSGRMLLGRGNSLAALRTAVGRGLSERKVEFLVIDEAAHLIRQTRGTGKLEIQLDTLKSLANECNTQMVLIGSYDLYRLVTLSGQLARRTHVLHFERYREDRPEDVRAFETCIQRFENELPNLWKGELLKYAGELHNNTLGCIGTLSSVLIRAARFAEADGRWSQQALQRALLATAQRDKILEEILEGEEAINPGLTRIMPKIQRRTERFPETAHRTDSMLGSRA
jgi:hypothetical protein